jgi:HAD superfamily hydrolase (TIGR01549 family)
MLGRKKVVASNYFGNARASICGIKVIVFDLDGTLYRLSDLSDKFEEHICGEIMKRKQASLQRIRDAFEKTLSESDKEVSNIFGISVLVCNRMGLTGEETNEAFDTFNVEKYLKCDSSLVNALNELKLNFRLVLATLASESRTRRYLKAIGIKFETFDLVVTGETFNFEKLNPAVFKEIASTLHVLPIEMLMVGDRIKGDLGPAKLIGMKTILVDSDQTIATQSTEIVVKDLQTLNKLLRNRK